MFVRRLSRYWPWDPQGVAEGLNPDVWFNNAELVAAKEIGAETVTYVSNIYKSYVSHQMALDNATEKRSKNARFAG